MGNRLSIGILYSQSTSQSIIAPSFSSDSYVCFPGATIPKFQLGAKNGAFCFVGGRHSEVAGRRRFSENLMKLMNEVSGPTFVFVGLTLESDGISVLVL